MLTRIEIDGFKSFQGFSLDLLPFTILVGQNAAGKSNLFDALHLLSLLATQPLNEAFSAVRGGPFGLFDSALRDAEEAGVRFAVEVLLPRTVTDSAGAACVLNRTRVRYEVEVRRIQTATGPRLVVSHERAVTLRKGDDRWAPSTAVPERYLLYQRRKTFLEPQQDQPEASLPEPAARHRPAAIEISQDGSQGRRRTVYPTHATVLSGAITPDFPHLLALRETLRSWRFLHFDPRALRRSSSVLAAGPLEPDGANLPTVLHRLRDVEPASNSFPALEAQLTALIPGVTGLDVLPDPDQREYRLVVRMRDEGPVPAALASDGTLRVTALLAMLHDPLYGALVCFEEPENGIHPARLRDLVGLLAVHVAWPDDDPDLPGQPWRQILLSSHSPVVLAGARAAGPVQGPGPLLAFMEQTTVVGMGQTPARRSRARVVRGILPGLDDSDCVSDFEVDSYLSHAQPSPETEDKTA
ncbi:MAG: AAA family ATPase [Fimbriimonadaceae bacterium]|nr:AAA family ATPase [Fimbriimonadaceae bacterium]